MMTTPSTKQMPHLFACLVSLGLAAIILFAAERILIDLEQATIPSTAPETFSLKNQGLAFQRAAAQAPNVLPIYGSSELLVPAGPERGNSFFRTAPTGFQLSPVGGGGATPLIMLQKIGALGSALRGKKLAISLSPNWFFDQKPGWQGYAGNFSPIADSEMVFWNALNFDLKREIECSPKYHFAGCHWRKISSISLPTRLRRKKPVGRKRDGKFFAAQG